MNMVNENEVYTLDVTCPHCLSNIRPRLIEISPGWTKKINERYPFVRPITQNNWEYKGEVREFSGKPRVFFIECTECFSTSLVLTIHTGYKNGKSESVSMSRNGEYLFKNGVNLDVIDTFPNYFDIPPQIGVPERALTIFKEAHEDLTRKRDPARIISTCRSVLDVCLKDLGAQGKSRRDRIQNLLTQGKLTDSLASWGNKVGDDANYAVHDATGDHETAKQHIDFLILFFEICYSLPEKISDASSGK